ncbi:MAG: Aminopeptidase YwaD precursor [Acidobacteria bacterium ADurb.Bin340]|nr:MAG: Aminopeptidase YwaD precursor [Acidobacteria bacterium ADurb.Bin340]
MAFTTRALVCCLLAAGTVGAQDAARMKQMLEYLASPALEGRETGQPGCVKAATYLAGRMQALGLATLSGTGMGGETPYHHAYTLSSYLQQGVTVNGTTLVPDLHYQAHGRPVAGGEAVYLGWGLRSGERDDYAGREVKGQWVVVLEGAPEGVDGAAATTEAKARAAEAAGAAGILLIQLPRSPRQHLQAGPAPFQPLRGDAFPLPASHPEGRLPRIHVNEAGARLLGFLPGTGDPAFGPVEPRSFGRVDPATEPVRLATQAANVVGVVPGTDPALKGQYVVVTAHFDHIGRSVNGYYPGADDNASGTAALMELAALTVGAAPKRSILFLACSGEEKGLLGSAAFVQNPPVSLSQIVANVNMDMLGRNATRTLYITPAAVSGQVTTLVKKARELVRNHDLDLSKGIDGYWRQSDHYSFAQRGIPAVFFNSGDHADLHRTTDTPDKIDYVKLVRAVALARDLVLAVANDPAKPQAVASSEYGAWTWPVKGSASGGGSDTQAPAVTASHGVSGTQHTFSATATDNVGVARVEFLVDGVLKGTDATRPYTLTLEATALAEGAHSLVAKAYDAAGNVGTSPSVAFTVGGGTPASELIQNGGFEAGVTPWTGTTGAIGTFSGQAPYAGSRCAWLGGNGRSASESLAQTVAIPSSATSATLRFQLHIDTAETTTSRAYDKLTVQVLNSSGTVLKTLATYSNLNKAAGYAERSFDLSAYRGQTVRLSFKATEDTSLQTSFVLDQVSLALR